MAGRLRRIGSTAARRLDLADAPIGAEADAPALKAEARPAEPPALVEQPATVEQPAPDPAPEAAAPVEIPPPVAAVAPAPARKPKPRPAASAAPAPRSAASRPVAARPATTDPLVSKFRKSASADEAEAIARHLAAKGSPKYEAGTMLALLERTFTAAGKTFEYRAGPKTARAPYVVNGRCLSPAKAIEQANEIRARQGLELLAVPGRPAKGGRR